MACVAATNGRCSRHDPQADRERAGVAPLSTVRATRPAAYRIDGGSASREAFYAAACDPRRSVTVEACAGAGKTWMLVSRVLRALLEGAEPHEILAITFTRKAAGEMRTRLQEWLRAFAHGQCDDERRFTELRARGLDEARAREFAPLLGGLYERVLNAGRPVEIRTFHAWFSQLLRGAPIDLLTQLGLHAEVEIVDDLSEHWPAILRRFHAAVLADAALGADFHALIRDRGRSQARRWLDAAWDKRVELELADAAGTLEASVPPAHRHWPSYAVYGHPAEHVDAPAVAAVLRAATVAMRADKGGTCRRQGELLAAALDAAEPRARFDAARAALYTQEGKPRQRIDAPGVAAALEVLEDIQRACHQQACHEEHLRMVRLARVLLREAAAYKRARGLADMADLERCALALLRDATLAGWVQERLDARIRHVLIDEFQDTSPLQWQALQAWLSGYAGAGGGASGQRPPSVFIVGDPKQSIYRFRRAEPRVFEAAREFVTEGLEGSHLACDHTRRNAPQVLAAINAVFEEAQRAGDFTGFRRHTTEIDPVAQAGVFALPRQLRPAAADVGGTAGTDDPTAWRDSLTVARVIAEERVREPEARRVGATVRDLLADGGWKAGEIYVLCRKRESLGLVAASLSALHLPHAAAEDFTLLDAIEARDLVAVLDVLVSPRHTLSLAHALRSPLFGASDDDLVLLASVAAERGGWWPALLHGDVPSPSLRRAADLLRRWRGAASALPPHDLLDRIVAEGSYRERVAAAVPRERRIAALGAIDALLGLALTLDGARYATPYNFVRALKRRALRVASPAQLDAVQLLTVHGAKGLEARAVFVVDADPEPRAAESALLLVDWPVEAAQPLVCAFVYSELRCAPSLEPLRDREIQARRREELNGLYVAMSRARELLVFSATAPYQVPADRSWWQRIEGVAAPWQPALAGAADATADVDVPVLRVLPPWRGPVLASTASTASTAAPALAASRPPPGEDEPTRLGKAVHRVLEWAAAAPSDVAIAFLADAAAREFDVAAVEVERIAGVIWNSPDCARFFRGPALSWAGNEVDVADGGDVLRIDRLVALDDAGALTWWVLDYKLRHAPERDPAYRAQLRRYARAVRRLQPGAHVRCAFVSGEGSLVEIDVDAIEDVPGATEARN